MIPVKYGLRDANLVHDCRKKGPFHEKDFSAPRNRGCVDGNRHILRRGVGTVLEVATRGPEQRLELVSVKHG
jgi:hypothetical protein